MNPEHVRVVRKGVKAIETWRRENPQSILDLRRAFLYKLNLVRANLSKADLWGASLGGCDLSFSNLSEAKVSFAELWGANLSGADMRKAKLTGSTFTSAKLVGANLVGADLRMADLTGTDLAKADFSGADLTIAKLLYPQTFETNLSKTTLEFAFLLNIQNVNVTNAIMAGTVLVHCNLGEFIGLETVTHGARSTVSFSTLVVTFHKAGNRFTPEVEGFLLNAGLPKDYVAILPKILTEAKYCSAFICYGSPDLKFAKKLRSDLMTRGASCWLYSLDATPGKSVWQEITSKRREAEKMVVLCSAEALVRDGVRKEIEEQIDEDPDKMVPISLDDTWKQEGFLVKRGPRDLKPFLLQRNWADFSKPSNYNNSLLRLLKGLERTK